MTAMRSSFAPATFISSQHSICRSNFGKILRVAISRGDTERDVSLRTFTWSFHTSRSFVVYLPAFAFRLLPFASGVTSDNQCIYHQRYRCHIHCFGVLCHTWRIHRRSQGKYQHSLTFHLETVFYSITPLAVLASPFLSFPPL